MFPMFVNDRDLSTTLHWGYCEFSWDLDHPFAWNHQVNKGLHVISYCSKKIDNDSSESGLILGLRPASETRHYKVTPSLIGSDLWMYVVGFVPSGAGTSVAMLRGHI